MKKNLLIAGLGLLAAVAARAEVTHVVVRGDTLWSIARHHGVSVEQLRSRNGLRGDLIVVGARLAVSGRAERRASTHTVARGENLFRIGRRYGVPVASLQEWNGLVRPEDLRAGSVLRLDGPRRGASEAGPAPGNEGPATPPLPDEDRSAGDIPDDILEPVVLEENMRFGDIAARHGMTVAQLNALNGWSFLEDDLVGAGTRVYVKD